MKRFSIIKPDDWHLHLRDGDMLELIAPFSEDFERAIIMPNLIPPIVNVQMAQAYKERIQRAGFAHPLMTLYLTEDTKIEDVDEAVDSVIVKAFKLYPAGATTNSASGVRDFRSIMPILEHMAKRDLVLCVHGEITNPEVDIFDREPVFIEQVLSPIRTEIPELRIVLEHVTTKDGVDYVQSQSNNMAATITTHHLLLDRNDLLVGGLKPHYYCLPIVKRSHHKAALRKVATSGDPRFFLGTDSAPHSKDKKECECCAAGVFSAPNTVPWLAQIFEEEDALDQLQSFSSENGAKFYKMPINQKSITLVKTNEPVSFPSVVSNNKNEVVVFDPDQPLYWKVEK